MVETFTEVETGKGADALERRPKLAAAIKAARKIKGPVIVSKLDVHFTTLRCGFGGRRVDRSRWRRNTAPSGGSAARIIRSQH